MNMRTLQIGLAVICAAWLIAFFTPLPRPRNSHGLFISDGLFIHNKSLSFMWLLPPLAWYENEPLTGADYAFNSGKGVSLVLDTWEESHDDAQSLTEKLRANPSVLFDGGIKPRFPTSRFLGSSVTTVNSQPAIQSECEFVTSSGNQVVNWFCCQVVTIHHNTAYNFVLECPIKEREFGARRMKEALAQFVFLDGNRFTYISPNTRKYEIQVPESFVPDKEFLADVAARASEYENSIGQHIIAAVINSFIQGMVLPFAAVPEMVADFLHSPDWGARGLLEGTEFRACY